MKTLHAISASPARAESDIWFRYTDDLVSTGYDYDRDCSSGSRVEVRLHKYYVLKTTPKGVWLAQWPHCEKPDPYNARFVLREARRRFACPTQGEALTSFVARKRRQLQIYQARIARARDALTAAGALGEVIRL